MGRIAAEVPVSERVKNAALLVVDMQNDFVRAGAPMEVDGIRETITPIADLVSSFRASGRPVIFTRFLSQQSDNLLWLWSPQCHQDLKCCWKGFPRRYEDRPEAMDCAEVVDELAPEPGEVVIDKYGYGSFRGTDLDSRLKAMGVQSLVIVGTVAQICVEETARESFHHGYLTTLVPDGLSSFAPDLQAATLRNFAMKFGWVADSPTVLSWLAANPERATLEGDLAAVVHRGSSFGRSQPGR